MDNMEELECQSEYSKNYSEKSLFAKIAGFAKKAGIKVIYTVLLLYFALMKKDTPVWVKGIIMSALGYFILPVDVIPDLAPAVGFGDDAGVLVAALGAVAFCIDQEVKDKAKKKLTDWFGDYDKTTIDDVDGKVEDK